MVKQNESYISVKSHPGCESTFRISIPRCSQASFGSKDAETILGVEDDPAILAMAGAMLQNLG